MADSFSKRAARPWVLGEVSLWHLPLPEIHNYGMHPNLYLGAGDELHLVRKLEPDDDMQFYSAQLSAEMNEPWGAFFLRPGEIKIVIVVDLRESMDFGVPLKRQVASKISASLAMSAMSSVNEGTVTFVFLGAKTYSSEPASDFTHAYSEIKKLLSMAPRSSRDGMTLSKALKRVFIEQEETLVIVLSDFLIDPVSEEEEWNSLLQVRSLARESGSEIVYIRVLDTLERDFPERGAVTVSGQKGTVWTNRTTHKHLSLINERIQENIAHVVGGPPEIRFMECTWRHRDDKGERVRDVLKRFLRKRDMMVRSRLLALA